MSLSVRDPRAHDLAKQLADQLNVTMTEAIITALESELQRLRGREPLRDRLAAIARSAQAAAGPNGREMSRTEIDAMWGH